MTSQPQNTKKREKKTKQNQKGHSIHNYDYQPLSMSEDTLIPI